MKIKSPRKKPPTGMELTITFFMNADNDVPADTAAILKFFETVDAGSRAMGASWLHFRCSGIPSELESTLRTALDKAQADMNARQPKLKMVVNNR